MAYHVQLLPAVVKQLGKLPRKTQERITEELAKLADDPRPRLHRKLTARQGEYRVRVGDYRIVYTIDDPRRIVEIGIIADRKDVYRKR